MELAAEILSMEGNGLGFLAECRPEELSAVKGIGEAKPAIFWLP